MTGVRCWSSGGRTRTPKDRTRTCCVADYTTPEGAAIRLADPVARSVQADSAARGAAAGASGARRGRAAAIESNSGRPRAAALDRGVERGHRLADFDAERLDRAAAEVERFDRPLARLDVRDHRVEHLARPGRSLDDLSHDSGAIPNSSSSTNRNAIWSTICTRVTARSCAIADRARRRPPGRTRSPKRARRRGLDARDELVEREAADPLAVQPVELLAVEDRRRRASRDRGRTPRPARRRRAPRRRRRPVPSRAARGSSSAPRGGSPSSRKSSSATAPWRFDSLAAVGVDDERQVGVLRHVGSRPSASRSASTRWVESMRSSPRITWVIPMSRSSTALARKKIGAPSDRTITKSWMSDHSTRTSPRIEVGEACSRPSSGVRNRIDARATLGGERGALVGGRGRGSGRRSPAARPAATAASLRSRTSSSVQ